MLARSISHKARENKTLCQTIFLCDGFDYRTRLENRSKNFALVDRQRVSLRCVQRLRSPPELSIHCGQSKRNGTQSYRQILCKAKPSRRMFDSPQLLYTAHGHTRRCILVRNPDSTLKAQLVPPSSIHKPTVCDHRAMEPTHRRANRTNQ